MVVFLIVFLYLISVVIGYFGVRKMLQVNNWDAEGYLLLAILIPLMNIVWGIAGLFDGINLNRFFRLKENSQK